MVVSDGVSEMSDEEGLKATMDALNDVIQKCRLKVVCAFSFMSNSKCF